jgi:hypothetical protein
MIAAGFCVRQKQSDAPALPRLGVCASTGLATREPPPRFAREEERRKGNLRVVLLCREENQLMTKIILTAALLILLPSGIAFGQNGPTHKSAKAVSAACSKAVIKALFTLAENPFGSHQ